MVGLLLLIAMFWQQWRAARYLDTPMQQALARGLVLTMVSGCMVNSMLLDHAEGLFYAWLCGLLYGGLIGDLRGDLTGDLSGLKYAERETLRDTSAASPTHT